MKTPLTLLLLLFATTMAVVADIDFNQLLDEQIAEQKARREVANEHDSVAQQRADAAASDQWIRLMETVKASRDNVLKAELLKTDYLYFIVDLQYRVEARGPPQERRKAALELAAYHEKLNRVQAWLDTHAPKAAEE